MLLVFAPKIIAQNAPMRHNHGNNKKKKTFPFLVTHVFKKCFDQYLEIPVKIICREYVILFIPSLLKFTNLLVNFDCIKCLSFVIFILTTRSILCSTRVIRA